MPLLRLIGDVHQRYEGYYPLLKEPDYTIQVGDLGLSYNKIRNIFDPEKHKAIAGNHDNYDVKDINYFKKQPFFLGDYGIYEIPGFTPIFYVRGAWSIDHALRKRDQGWPSNHKGPVTWWEDEELSHEEMNQVIELYKEVRPAFVVTHDAPLEVASHLICLSVGTKFGYGSRPVISRTNLAFQRMFEEHSPKSWFFGHYHRSWGMSINGTNFQCIDMIRDGSNDCYFDIYF